MNIVLTDISLPTWLVVSQWVLLFALGFLIFVMYRQTQYLQILKDRGSERDGLAVGEKASVFDCIPMNQRAKALIHFEPVGKWSLLLFADPGCVSCQNALLALEELLPKLGRVSQVVVATTSQPDQIVAVEAFDTESFAIIQVAPNVLSRLYRTGTTPFVHLIDPRGIVRAKGAATDKSSILKVVRKADHNIPNVELVVS